MDLYMEWENSENYTTQNTHYHASTSEYDQVIRNGNTVLHAMCFKGNLHTIKHIVQNGSTVQIKNFRGETSLHIATKSNSNATAKIVEVLLKNGADVNDIENEGNTALHLACINNDPKVVNLLLKFKSYINARNFYMNSPLHVCIESKRSQKQEDVVNILIKNKADLRVLNNDGNTPLHLACIKGNLRIVNILLKHYIDVNAKNIQENTPLHLCVQYASKETKEIIRLLVKYDAILNAVNKNGDTALHLACRNGDVNIIDVLIQYYTINVFIKNHDRQTPFQTFIIKKRYDEENKEKAEIITTIITNGPDTLTIFENGNTSLHLACLKGDLLSVIVLLDKKANIMAKNQQGETPLHFAIKSKSSNATKIIRNLLEQGAFINAVDNDGDTPLHLATAMKDEKIIHTLSEYNANVYIANQKGETPLHYFIGSNPEKISLIKFVEKFRVNINNRDNDGNTLLHLACMKNNPYIIKILLNYFRANINVKNHQENTPLHVSIYYESTQIEEIITILGMNKINVLATNKFGNTALHLACSLGNLRAVLILLIWSHESINKKNTFGQTPLHLAILSTSTDAIEIIHSLLKHQVNVNLCDLYRNTPLHLACLNKNVELIRILLDCHADVNAQNLPKNTPLHIILGLDFSKETLNIIDILIKYGAKLEIPSMNGNTALHLACIMGKSDVVNAILQHQSNVNARNLKLVTPLHVCVQFASREFNKIIKALIRNKADINVADYHGDTALHFACFHGDLNAINALLDNCANVNAKNFYGDTPLHVGVNFKSDNVDEIVETLVRSQADINAVNLNGDTPLHSACENGNREYAKALFLYGPNVNIKNNKLETPLDIAVKNQFENIVEIFLKSSQ